MAEALRQERLRSLRIFPDAVEAIKRLSSGHILALVTNGQPDYQRAKVEALGLLPYFQVFLISGEVGMGKPAPGIFLEAARRVGVNLSEAMHIGDSLANDVAGAKAAGLTAVWLNRAGTTRPADAPVPDHEIASLGELL